MKPIPTRTVLHVDSGVEEICIQIGVEVEVLYKCSSTRQFYQGSANSAISSAFISFNAEL